MPSASPIAAVRALYGTLTAAHFPNATRPPIYFAEVPLYDGGQARPPYCVLKDNGLTPEFDVESNAIETGALALEVYADTLEHVDQIVLAVKYNGLAPRFRAGFDFAAPALDAPYRGMVLKRAPGEVRGLSGTGVSVQRVHWCVVNYTFTAQVVA